MIYMKIYDEKTKEKLINENKGEIIDPYNALIEESLDAAITSLEFEYNITSKKEKEDIKDTIREEALNVDYNEEGILTDVYHIVLNEILKRKGGK